MNEYERFLTTALAGDENALKLDPIRTALVVVDMQNYFTRPGYSLTELQDKISAGMGSAYLQRVREKVLPNIIQLLACFREAGGPVFFTAVGTETGKGDDLPPWLREMDEHGKALLGKTIWPPVGDPSWEIDRALERQPEEIVLNKLSAGTFATTNLEQRLHASDIDTVIVAGVATDVCVTTTAREAADRGFKMITVSDACTTMNVHLHEANLVSLRYFGAVRPTAEVLDALYQSVTEP